MGPLVVAVLGVVPLALLRPAAPPPSIVPIELLPVKVMEPLVELSIEIPMELLEEAYVDLILPSCDSWPK